MTRVLTTVVVIELKIKVVVVTVVDPSPEDPVPGVSVETKLFFVASAAVPRIVRLPMIVETKVLGGITVVKTEVIVRGESLV